MDLHLIEAQIRQQFDALHMPERAFGCYAAGAGQEPDSYTSLDVVLSRVIMGEDFHETLRTEEREAWCAYINSFAQEDGTYTCWNHSPQHANGMVIGALGPLGGKQLRAVSLYDEFNTPEKVGPWLETIDWSKQWSASHLFWGGMHCFAMSDDCDDAWRDAVFNWLDAELDPQTGWWRKGVAHSDRHQPLGGSVHIIPIYQHLGCAFPYPQQLVDSCLNLQMDNACWLAKHTTNLSYLELDALYVFAFCRQIIPDYRRKDVEVAVERYGNHAEAVWKQRSQEIVNAHPHHILAAVGIFGLLNQLNPQRWTHEKQWTDIFSDPRLYMVKEVSSSILVN